MIIENLEALRLWLKKTLTPICDADPNTLSQYVVALLKKTKPDKDLKEFCLDQLDVFLQHKTKGFVETLFETLATKSYLALASAVTPPPPSQAPPPPPPTEPPSVLTPVSQNQLTNQPVPAKSDKRKKSDEISEEKGSYRRHSGSPPRSRGRDGDRDDRRRRYDDRSRFPAERRGYGREDSSRRRSRSRSRDRSPRNRSRGDPVRSRGRSRDRSRSPYRLRSRSRSRTPSPPRSPHGRRPDPDSRGSTPVQDNGKYSDTDARPSPVPIASAISVVSRSGDNRYDWNSHGGRNTPPPPRPRCKDYDEKGFCMRGDLCPFDHGLDPLIVEDINIPPVLPYPPGPPPPPPPGMPMRPRGPGRGGPRMPGPPGPPGPGPRGMGPRAPRLTRPPPPPPGQDRLANEPFGQEGYNPEAPAITVPRGGFWAPPRGPRPTPPNNSNSRSRDLVQVRTVPEEEPSKDEEVSQNGQSSRTVVAPKRPYTAMSNSAPTEIAQEAPPRNHSAQDRYLTSQPHKRHFDYNRLGPSYRQNTDNATLEVRKIPPEFNSIARLNEHFGKFGTLVNIQVRHEDSPDAALITFSSNAEALSAYRSSEPVFNNRFIKLFWHKPPGTGSNQSNSSDRNTSNLGEDQRIPVKVRLTIPSPDKLQLNNTVPKPSHNTEKPSLYTPTAGTITKTVFNPAALKSITSPTSASVTMPELQKKAKAEEQVRKQQALKKKLELQKQKQQLLQKYIEQQKLLLGKLEKNKSMSAEDKATIMKTIKEFTGKIDKLKEELMPKKSPEAHVFKSDVEAKKEILDTELELISKQHAGDDTSDLRKKLDDLTREAASMGLLSVPRRGRGRGLTSRGRGLSRGRGRGSTTWSRGGGARGGRGRGFTATGLTLDRRPKQLQISGFLPGDKNGLLVHIAQFGEVENINFEGDKAAIVTFKTRQDAEKVALGAGSFKGQTLIMKWHVPGLNASSLATSDDEDDDVGGGLDEIDEEALLAPDDEEEEDEESRSWRR